MFSKAMFEYYEIFIIELGLLHLLPRTPLNALKDFLTGLYEFSSISKAMFLLSFYS